MSKLDRLDYIEFAATDMAAMKSFYAALFGWEFIDFGDQYTSFQLGHVDGGFDASRKPAEPGTGTLIVFYANDIDAMEARVRELGAKLTVELFDFPGGRRFQFLDPSGNELAIWTDPVA